jgi:hypothetical protein
MGKKYYEFSIQDRKEANNKILALVEKYQSQFAAENPEIDFNEV